MRKYHKGRSIGFQQDSKADVYVTEQPLIESGCASAVTLSTKQTILVCEPRNTA